MNQDLSTQLRSVPTLNVLLLGETNVGDSSIIDLIAGPGAQRLTPRHAGRRDELDVRNVALDGKMFILHTLPTNDSTLPPAVEEIQNKLTNLRKKGSVHLLVYCINLNASHPINWIHEVHHIITTPFPRIPAVAIVAGTSSVAEQENRWSSVENSLAEQGLRFNGRTFIPKMANDTQPPIGDHISETRRVLHALIVQNVLNSEMDPNLQCATLYKQPLVGNSFPSFSTMLAGKTSSRTFSGPKTIEIVLLGEAGVGKSSLINLIVGENIAEVSSDTIGCTKTTAKYTFEEKDTTFHLYDTPGLVDPQMGVTLFIDPIVIIQKLIRNLGNGSGPDLLLFCIDNSKPTVALQRNYRLFCKVICGGKVPFALAITKLEEGRDADQWWSRYGSTIRRYGIDCSGYVGFGREKRISNFNADSQEESRESLLALFVACTDRQKGRMNSLRSSVERMVGSVTYFLRSQISTPERTLMNQCGLDEQIARELVNRMTSSQECCANLKVYT